MEAMIKVHWHDPDEHILCLDISGRTTLEQFQDAVDRSHQIVSAKPHIVDVIVVLDSLVSLSFNILRMTWLASVNRASNTGVAVIVGPTSIWKELWETMIKLFGKTSHTVRFASTIAQAENIIREVKYLRART